jgi:hypothetical protein
MFADVTPERGRRKANQGFVMSECAQMFIKVSPRKLLFDQSGNLLRH